MDMFKKSLILFLLASSLSFAMHIKDKFMEAKVGSYIVTEQNKTYTLLHVHTRRDTNLILEEISIPSAQARNLDWKKWAETGAIGHTSWIMYTIDLDEMAVTECYSFTKETYLPTETIDAFLTTLIKLKLHFLTEQERIQKSPNPRAGQIVPSVPWGPPQFRDGKKVKNPSYEVYQGVWPNDDTELSRKAITLYFDETDPSFPFPYWLQVREGGIKVKMRAVDSGHNLSSPQKELPRRPMHFTGGIVSGDTELCFKLIAPRYYTTLKLYAIDTTTSPRQILSLPMSMSRSQETVTLKVDKSAIQDLLTRGHRYLFVTTSEEGEGYIEHPTPLLWKN